MLFALDRLLKGVIRMMTRVVEGIANFLPIPGTQTIVGLIRGMLKLSVGFLDELILAHAIRTRSDNPWQASAQALVLYGQNGKAMMKNAFFATLFMYLVSALLFAVFLVPAGLLVWMLPGQMSAMTLIFALVFAWAAKAALLEPLGAGLHDAGLLQGHRGPAAGPGLGPAPDPDERQVRQDQATGDRLGAAAIG